MAIRLAKWPQIALTLRLPATDQIIPAGYSAVVAGDYEIASGLSLELAADSVLEIS